MASSGNHPDSNGQLTWKATDALQRLKALEQRVNRIDPTLNPARNRLDRLTHSITDVQEKLGQLEKERKELRDREDERARQHEALQSGLRDVAVKTAAVQREIESIDEVLPSGLQSRPPAFSELKEPTQFPPFDPAAMRAAEPVLALEQDPRRPRFGFFGGMSRYEREKEAVQDRNDAARAAHSRRHARWRQELDQARNQYNSDIAAQQAAAEQHNAVVEENSAGFDAGDPKAISWYLCQVLARSPYPSWYPSHDRQHKVICRPDRHDIFIEIELPPASVVPVVQGYQHLPGQAESLPLPRSRTEVSQQYRRLIAAIALRTMSEALAATATHVGAVRAATLNGRAHGIDAATGRASHPNLLSVSASREALNDLELSRVQPDTCLAYLGARISPDPLALQPAEPLEPFPPDSATEIEASPL